MSKKRILAALLLLVSASAAWAYLSHLFPGWGGMLNITRDALLVRCKTSPRMIETKYGLVLEHPDENGIFTSEVEVVSNLKGQKMPPGTKATLESEYWPFQGETYLVFAEEIDGTAIKAFEEYRVVPLGHRFSTNYLAGKNLDEQIKAALQYRLGDLKFELEHAQTEKQRLEEFLKK
jgi:hypothetical protein